MLTAQDLRKITDENRVKLLLEAKEELMKNIMDISKVGNSRYYMGIHDSYLVLRSLN